MKLYKCIKLTICGLVLVINLFYLVGLGWTRACLGFLEELG